LYTNKSGLVRDMAWQLREQITKRRQDLANSQSWNIIWNWAPQALPLAGPPFMLLLILLFGSCIISVLSRFISQQVQWIKLQLLVEEYSPLPMHEPSILFYWGPLETTWVNPWDKNHNLYPPVAPLPAWSS
jgi:hypothetical protein